MSENDPKILELEARLDSLVRTQIDFQVEVTAIRKELTRLRGSGAPVWPTQPKQYHTVPKPPDAAPTAGTSNVAPPRPPVDERKAPPTDRAPNFTYGRGYQAPKYEPVADQTPGFFSSYVENARADLEKFIGENLISKIGIIVLILGVGIGAKYAIDNEMISPLARIVLGYLAGFGLLGVAVWFKPNYHKFSAVLLSGGMAIMYFITYFAYSAYQLIDQPTAFALMVMFTVFTVIAACVYDLQVIAHIGLVGAYAVPFLLSNDSGNYLALFAYVVILNIGVLAVSVKRYWRAVFYTASFFTWAIFAVWLVTKYQPELHLYLALGTLWAFFAIFYATKIIHGVIHFENEEIENVVSIVVTGLIFYLLSAAICGARGTTVQYAVILSYLALTSLGILITSYRFYGRMLLLLTYPFTWLIFGAWFIDRFSPAEHLGLAAIFASIYFAIFYGTTLIYRLATDRVGLPELSGMMLTNSFIYYGFGYAILDSRVELQSLQGLFTVGHAAFHSIVAQLVARLKQNASDVVQILTILIITFATIAVPVQFDGNFVTLIWSVEAAALFYFGRTRQIHFFEYFAFPLMALAAGSRALDWIAIYGDRGRDVESALRPFANGDMITSLVFVAAFAFIYFANTDNEKESVLDETLIKPFGYLTATVGLFALWNTFRIEISNFLHIEALLRGSTISQIPDVWRFNTIAQIDYTLLFLMAVAAVNIQKVKSRIAAFSTIGLSVLTLAIFLTVGMTMLYGLRESYLAGTSAELFGMAFANVAVRYFSYAFAAGLILALYAYRRSDMIRDAVDDEILSVGFDAILYPALLIILSCEVMNVAAHLNIASADKYGLSILWGVFALAMIAIGIAQAKKHVRIAAIVLFAVTLVKLFFYDVTDLGTIPKTILFVSLGLLLLVISFLYNKYKDSIFGPETVEK